jgi:methylenetetrahydrofolate dehydrogenase (NADP+)/methenyltetrahydrofolate cyclohydrolase
VNVIIDCSSIAEHALAELRARPHIASYCAALLSGDDPASERFVRQKERTARSLGIDFRAFRFSGKGTTEELLDAVRMHAEDAACGGIIVQLPLPPHIDTPRVIAAIPIAKDVDVLNPASRDAGMVRSPSVGTLVSILSHIGNDAEKLFRQKCAVVGRGALIGGPVSAWLEGRCGSLISLDKGDDFGALRDADIVVLGAGSPGCVNAVQLKHDAVVVDFGYGRKQGILSGDFDAAGAPPELQYTPTPGGTGPVLVTELFRNFFDMNAKKTSRR